MTDDPLWPWRVPVPSPAELEHIKIVDEPHNEVWAVLLEDGSVRLSATTGDPFEYATLRPGQVAAVARELAALAERANDQANAPRKTPA